MNDIKLGVKTDFIDRRQRFLPEDWDVRTIAVFTALVGVINVLSAVTPSQADRLAVINRLLSLTVQYGGRLTTALSGFALIILANGLSRRKRIAWLLTLVVLAISILGHLIQSLNYEESL